MADTSISGGPCVARNRFPPLHANRRPGPICKSILACDRDIVALVTEPTHFGHSALDVIRLVAWRQENMPLDSAKVT